VSANEITASPPAGPLPRGAIASPERLAMGLRTAGQSLLLEEYDNILSCIRCGLCLTSCPTYVLTGHEAEGPRGRIAMARALVEGHLALTEDLVTHEKNCLVCDACTAVCPAGVHMDPLQVALRAAIEPQRARPVWERTLRYLVFKKLFPDMGAFRLLVRLIWLYQRSGLQWLVRTLGLLRLLGLEKTEAFLPPVSSRFLVPSGEVYAASSGNARAAGSAIAPGSASSAASAGNVKDARSTGSGTPVAFFAGCVMSTALAETDRATIRVLQRAGCDVTNTAGQGCCGALNAHSGDLPAALNLARRNIVAFETSDGPIAVNSAGCGAMLKDYGHHFRNDPAWSARATAFSQRVRDATEVLSGRALPLSSQAAAKPLRVTYQEPCHLAHAQRIRQQPRDLLRSIPGVTLVEMNESTLCCGSAGIYNVTNPKESGQLQQRKLDNALATQPDVIATANPGCQLQLQCGLRARGSSVQVKHIVDLLDDATG